MAWCCTTVLLLLPQVAYTFEQSFECMCRGAERCAEGGRVQGAAEAEEGPEDRLAKPDEQ